MATETLNLNLNEANPPEESPTQTLQSPSSAEPSAQPPSSTVNGTDDAPQEEVDGSNFRDEVDTVDPSKALSGDAAPDSDVQKKMRRAERFGMPVLLSETEKRSSRAERFGSAPTSQKSDASKKSEVSKKEEETKRKARAERFGLPVLSESTEEDAKKKARLARFAPPSKVDSVEEDKRKARALRFSEAPSSILPEANGKGNIEPAVIAGKAIGGV